MTAGRSRRETGGRRARQGVLAIALAGALVAGCGSARASLGTADSGCYVALPTAGAAVHHRGHFVGVRLVGVAALRTTAPRMFEVARSAPGPTVRRVCLVAFGGSFSSADVVDPWGQAQGRLAVVVVEYPDRRLLGTVVIRHPPLRFGHPHLLSG